MCASVLTPRPLPCFACFTSPALLRLQTCLLPSLLLCLARCLRPRLLPLAHPEAPRCIKPHLLTAGHLLYLWGLPSFEEQKVDAWSSWAQATDGHVYETLAGFNHGALDHPGGRTMADTTSLVVLEAFELWRHTANLTRLKHRWPNVKRAARWCIANANRSDDNTGGPSPPASADGVAGYSGGAEGGEGGYGLPQFLTNTYDHFGFEHHRAVAYNAHVYLAAVRAAKELASALNDTAMHDEATAALGLSTAAIVDPQRLWNETHGYFRSHTTGLWNSWVKTHNGSAVNATPPAYHGYNDGYLAAGDDLDPPTQLSPAMCKASCDATNACRGYCYELFKGMAPNATIKCFTKATAHLIRTDGPWSPEQIFTDTLYGQMLHHHHFDGGFSIDASYLRSHLAAEWRMNHDTFGMRVQSNPTQEDSVWLNGPPTWSYLQLALGGSSSAGGSLASGPSPDEALPVRASAGDLPLDEALEPLRRLSENLRTRLHDMWNLRALMHTDGSLAPVETNRSLERGAPREQGHYAFMLTDLYLLPLLSGQSFNLPASTLSLRPRFPPPYVLPVLLAGVEASLESRAKGNYTLRVAFGRLRLPRRGGLIVDGTVCPLDIDLSEGEAVSWSA